MYRFALGHERMLTLIKIKLQFPAVMYSLIGSAFFQFQTCGKKAESRLIRQITIITTCEIRKS